MNKLGRGVGLFVLVLEGGRNRWGCGVGFVDVGNFEGAMVKYGCVLCGFGAGVGLCLSSNTTFCSIISPPLKSRHTVSPVSGLKELSASGLTRSPFSDFAPLQMGLNA